MNAAAVSRFLGKTYKRSVTCRTKIRGYSLTTAGYSVRQLQSGVAVFYNTGDWNSQSDINEITNRKAQMYDSIRQTLIKNGFELHNGTTAIVVVGKRVSA